MTTCTERSTLKQNSFSFIIPNAPNFNATVTDVNIPTLSMGEVTVGTTVLDYFVPGEKLQYAVIVATFKLQENLANYKEIFDWMHQISSPEFAERADYEDIMRDATLYTKTNQDNIASRIVFRELFPVDLSDINFTVASDEEMEVTVTFRYCNFDVLLGSTTC